MLFFFIKLAFIASWPAALLVLIDVRYLGNVISMILIR